MRAASLLGYVELGEEVDSVIHDLQSVFQVELVVAIDKHYLKRADWEAGMRQLGRETSWERLPGVVITAQTLTRVPDSLAVLLAGLPGQAPGAILRFRGTNVSTGAACCRWKMPADAGSGV